MYQGRCLCDGVHFEIDGPLTAMLHCHCSMCRKHHGTAFSTWVVAPLAGLRITAGNELIGHYESSPGVHRSFCTRCGSVTPEASEALGLAVAPAGNLSGDLGIVPQFHMFVGSKAKWYRIEDDLPQYEEYPPMLQRPATQRQAPAVRDGVTAGSCLCGGIAYELTGTPVRFFYCHCERCRLGRSAAHATNVFFRVEGLRWVRGEELLTDYPLPGAQFFGTTFCSRCGGEMPRVMAARGVVAVPAGSLDSEPGIEPMCHIYVDSRAAWDCIGGALPQFSEMPTRS